jgi:putative toxin-antitoxin system antitoxin component (TIGR02293 family)
MVRGAQKQQVAEAAVDYAASVPVPVSGQHEYLALLGLRAFDTASLLKRLDEGLSYAAFERLKRRLQVSSQELADAALITRRTLARRKKAGRFESGESDRLVRLARVFSRVLDLFEGDSEGAREWMMRPRRALGGPSPFEMARTEVGAGEVERLIHQLEHGVII